MDQSSIYQLIKEKTEEKPEDICILALDRTPITYSQLFNQVNTTITKLNELGIGRNDRVALVIPNGPEMATAFLSIACAATSAPLNPSYQTPEFEFFLSDLDSRALITLQGFETPAIVVAKKLKIPLIQLIPDEKNAGLFTLTTNPCGPVVHTGPAQGDDIALLLHTSGTTSQPKIVPLSHQNVTISARNIQQTLRLSPVDRCLNIMPLFHIHGLMAAVLASIASGASLVCMPGFYAPRFFEWLDAFQPTWYTAVPTMHQGILARAVENQVILEKVNLRFIRSSSSRLAPQIMADLERVFKIPVVEAYGMTEASHQMTCNPLPPFTRKSGSVGPAAGPEVAIMAENGSELLPVNTTGEIVIKGENVTKGYLNNPEANQKSFTNGWFRTGDQGYKDEDGYLFITGRLKEIINRGGEKISPREIDEILLSHPAVSQALTFTIPDEKLGEEIAAAVVLHDPALTERELRQYAAKHLAQFKIPRRIVFLDEIPKGPTGKLQRIGLAKKLGFDETAKIPKTKEFVAPRTSVESILAELWCEVLGIDEVSVAQGFLELGGDSMMASQLISRIQQWLEIELTLVDFFDAPTIAEQALIANNMLLNIIVNQQKE
jgi:acyl-CoA synthetase (AMP-forming)/AMP-acid ligase II/acyl carrier protein